MIYGNGTKVRRTTLIITALVAGLALAEEPEATLTVTAPAETVRAGKTVHMVYDVAWEGGPDSIQVLPLEFEPVEWGTISLTKSEAYRDGQLNHVAQTVAITPGHPGEYHVPEIQVPLRYPEATFPTEEGTDESGSPHPGAYPTLRADPLPLTVRAARSPAWISGGLGASFFLAALLWYIARRRWEPVAEGPALSPEERYSQARQRMHDARRHRLDGNFKGYYTELSRAASVFNAPELKSRLDQFAERVAYANARPTDDDLDAAWREVERAATRREAG